jgi:hypothetical protein
MRQTRGLVVLGWLLGAGEFARHPDTSCSFVTRGHEEEQEELTEGVCLTEAKNHEITRDFTRLTQNLVEIRVILWLAKHTRQKNKQGNKNHNRVHGQFKPFSSAEKRFIVHPSSVENLKIIKIHDNKPLFP